MSKRLYEMTEDTQNQIREAAYLMWESAGRQHGMAMEYWLKAESDMLSTMQAATAMMISSISPDRGREPTVAPPADPASENPPPQVETTRQKVSEPMQALTVEAPPEVKQSATADGPAAEMKQPATRKPAVRSKLKA
jgi:hypothetical protein